MPVLKFKTFEALDRFGREGKGISWNFRPDQTYFTKALHREHKKIKEGLTQEIFTNKAVIV